MITLLTNRAARLRADGDRGFALIFVLFVTTVVMIGTATTLAVASGGIKPSRQNQDNAAALSAAQAGVQRMLAMLDANCPSGTVAQCSKIATAATTSIKGLIGSEQYTVNVINPGTSDPTLANGYRSPNNRGTLVVKSVGVSPVAGIDQPATNSVSRTVTAAVSAKPNPLSLAYFSNYETVGSQFLNSYFGPRQITLSNPLGDPVLSTIGVSALTATVKWNGTQLASPAGLGDNICDKLWYDDPSNVNDGDTSNAGRASLKSTRTALPTATDYAEAGTLTPLAGTGTSVTRYAPCETTFATGQNFKGSVYSRDAFYLSKETTGGAGPTFSVPNGETQYPALWTGWQSTSSPAANVSNPYRSFPVVGGTPATVTATGYQGTLSSSPYGGLSLPSGTGITAGNCTFTGPTKVKLSGSTATVTSPATSNAGATCPGSQSGSVWTVPVTTTTLYVQNASASIGSSAMNSVINPPSGDITYYSPSAGDAYLSGTLDSGRLSLVTADDIVVTGNTGATSTATAKTNAGSEPSWTSGMAAVDLVATNDVRVFHPVTCLNGSATYGANSAASPSGSAPNGWCPNDITGLVSTTQSNEVIKSDGTLRAVHPSLQYVTPSSVTEPTTINAAVFALNGSLYADNFDRGTELGALTVTGGVYENHHGLLGEEWATPTGATVRHYSGFKLKINYLDYSNAGLGYVPELSGGNDLEPWQIVNVSSGGPTTS